MSTLVIKRSAKNILIEQANQSTGMFGKFGSSKRLISLLEKENYLIPIDQLQNKSYSQKMNEVECYYHHSRDKSINQIVMILLEPETLKVLDFKIMN